MKNKFEIQGTVKFLHPLQIEWKPKDDITAYELSLCIGLLSRQSPIMPYDIDTTQSYMRHFKINDPNK